MRRWEKRLWDLSVLLENCLKTYLEPDLFCMNTNQFLQTARTVSFLIQKDKSLIPDFDVWYNDAVLAPWGKDEVMKWAKESRNIIEKQGDLELHSSLKLTLVYSYLEEEDTEIECNHEVLLNAHVKQLVRLAQKQLPTGISDAAAVLIERRWVTSSLSNWELLNAMSYVYARHYECCRALAKHLGTLIDKSIPTAGMLSANINDTRQVRYFKLNGQSTYSMEATVVKHNPKFVLPEELCGEISGITVDKSTPMTLASITDYYARMAEINFNYFGSHMHMIFLLDSNYRPIDIIGSSFESQADKYIFWRGLAERIITLKATGLVCIAETWLRQMDVSGATAIRNMKIIGERLHLIAMDNTEQIIIKAWDIKKSTPDAKPTLNEAQSDEKAIPINLTPAMRAMGIERPKFLDEKFKLKPNV